jgi:transketolase
MFSSAQNNLNDLESLAKLVRYYILKSTSSAESGHPTSSLSAVELLVSLFFGGNIKYDPNHPENPNNDRFILSKGHASPLWYSIFTASGYIQEKELMTLRKFSSRLEGHPSINFPLTEAPTGSLGQGLSVGVGMAINAKFIDKSSYKTFVLLGDGEMTEGSNWEALQIASHYQLSNLIGIIDTNNLEQDGETPQQKEHNDHGTYDLKNKIEAFGWKTIVIDGHSLEKIQSAYTWALNLSNSSQNKKPIMIIAKTIKGNGISFLENQKNWHGKALKKEEFDRAMRESGEIDVTVRGEISPPENRKNFAPTITKNISSEKSILLDSSIQNIINKKNIYFSTRKAFGLTLAQIGNQNKKIISLDAGMSNSTFSEIFAQKLPDRFFEMFIAEQNMVGVAVGLAKRGNIPVISTFSAFLTRAFDQLRMAGYAKSNIKIMGSHAGVSIGEDGFSQMGLEDIALFRAIFDSVIVYPSDAISTAKLTEAIINHQGLAYLRATRQETPILYSENDEFPLGGSKTLFESDEDEIAIIGAGITLHEAIKAYHLLKKEKIVAKIIDLYSIKPIDIDTLLNISHENIPILVVEDHFPQGGIAEAVRSALAEKNEAFTKVHSLAVRKMPRSGTPAELLDFEEISATAIIKKVKEILK